MASKPTKLEADVARALRAYRKTGARELPSVVKSVPSAFKKAVDDLVAALDRALEGGSSK